MGLMYLFPIEDENDDRVIVKDAEITLKTYGLPMIFWGYLAAIFVVIGAMWLASASIIQKMLTYDDPLLNFLAILVQGVLVLTPTILLGFYFYEKFLIKKGNDLTIIHRVFFIQVYKKKIKLDSIKSFKVEHFLNSPNIAKQKNQEELRGFENKGYFELFGVMENKNIFIDRSSRKVDLVKLKELLSKY